MALYQHRFIGAQDAGDDFVFAWWSDSAASIDTAQAAAVQWLSDLVAGPSAGNGLQDRITSGVSFSFVRTGLINVADGQQQQLRETAVTHAGVATGNSLPADVALVCSLRTDLANRRGRGRFYLPALSTITVTAGKLTTSHQVALADALEFAWNGYSSTGSPVVYSRTSRAFQPVVTFDVGNLFDTQRRREAQITEVREARTMP